MKNNIKEDFLQEIIIDLIKKFFNNLRLYSLKKLLSSRLEKILYAIVIISHMYFLTIYRNCNIKASIIVSVFSYFAYKAIVQETREEYFRRIYSGFSKMFDKKAKVINKVKNKDTGIITYTVYSFIPRQKIVSSIDNIENYFNADVEIKLHEHNKRLLYVIAQKFKSKKSVAAKKFKAKYYLKDYIATEPIGEIPYLLGIGEDGKVVFGDLKKEKQILTCGDNGSGKSIFINSMLLSMMSINDNISYFLVDFKWVELKIYEKLNNVRFVDESKFFEFLEELDKELDRRKQLICDAELQNIDQYNSKVTKSNQLPYIVLLIDEIADIKINSTDKKLTERIENILLRYLLQGRALGMFGVFATQRPSGVQLSTQIRAALVTKMSFRVEDKTTQKMAGVEGTETLKNGEFKIKRVGKGSNIETFKSFFVDRVEEWSIFEKLKAKNGNNKRSDYTPLLTKEKN